MAAVLPIVALGLGAVYVVPAIENQYNLNTDDNDDQMDSDLMSNLDTFGASAASWRVLINNQFLMGAPASDIDYINYEAAHNSYMPGGAESLKSMYKQHENLFAFDREQAEFSLYAMRGEIRPERAQPIYTGITPELYYPNDPNKQSQFLASSYVPNEAHFAQIQDAKRIAASDDPERSLRRENGVTYYNRAPFTSFRYSDY